MEYMTVPFDPPTSRDGTANVAATQLQSVIAQHAASGWEYTGVANHSTVVPGSMGCFGFGATAPYPVTLSIVVFKR
jgi:hypothetical protein